MRHPLPLGKLPPSQVFCGFVFPEMDSCVSFPVGRSLIIWDDIK